MSTTETRLKDFIQANKLTMTAQWADHNPHMADSANMDHWKVKIRKGKQSMSLYFSKRFGHHGKEPQLDEVLDCLASDASSTENAMDFEDWASEFGYDVDSRKAEKSYKTIEQQKAKLLNLLGDEAYQQLLYETERL